MSLHADINFCPSVCHFVLTYFCNSFSGLQTTPITATATDFTNIASPIQFSPTVGNPCSAPSQFIAVDDSLTEQSETFSVSIINVFPADLEIGPPVTLEILDRSLSMNNLVL